MGEGREGGGEEGGGTGEEKGIEKACKLRYMSKMSEKNDFHNFGNTNEHSESTGVTHSRRQSKREIWDGGDGWGSLED